MNTSRTMRVPITIKEAFTEPMNLALLALTAMSPGVLHSVVPALAAVGLETGYILFVGDSPWYRGVLRGRAEKAARHLRAQRKKEMLPGLLPQDKSRFLALENLRNQVPMAAAANFGHEEMGAVYSQMDVLLDKFLDFAAKNAQYRAYLVDMVRPVPGASGTSSSWADLLFDIASRLLNEKQETIHIPVNGPPRRAQDIGPVIQQIQQGLDARIEKLKASLGAQTADANRQVVAKNIEVVQKRRARIGELADIINNLECQLDLIESTFGLIADQVRTLAPEQVLQDINDVVMQTETTTQLLAASAPLEFQMSRLNRTVA